MFYGEMKTVSKPVHMVILQHVTALIHAQMHIGAMLTDDACHAYISFPSGHLSPKKTPHTHSSVAQKGTCRFILGRAPWFNLWVAAIKQLSLSAGWDWFVHSQGTGQQEESFRSAPSCCVHRPIRSPGTASPKRRRRKPSSSLVWKHQKTGRRVAGAYSPAGEQHLSASVQLSPFFTSLFPEWRPAKGGTSPQLMRPFILRTLVTFFFFFAL